MAYDILPVTSGVTPYDADRDQYIQTGIRDAAATADLAIPRGTLALATSLTQLLRVEIPDDGSPTGTWPDRLAFFYVDPDDGPQRAGYANEYGEWRARAAKSNTVAFRAMPHPDNTTAAILQVTDEVQAVEYLSVNREEITATIPFVGPNVPVDKIRTTDATPVNNSTTLVTDDIMQFGATAGTYVVEGALFYDASAVADMKVQFNYSGTGTGILAGAGLTTAATSSATNQSNHAARVMNSSFAIGGFGVGSVAGFLYRGVLTLTGAGTFAVQYAQQNQEVSDLVVRAGSHLSYRRSS